MSATSSLVKPLADLRRTVRANSKRRALVRRDLDPSAGVVICGEARSGSTWLMELFAQLPGTVCNWEPMHPERGVLPAEWAMGWRPFVPEEQSDPRLQQWFDDVFRFRIANHWTLSHVGADSIPSATVGVHKFVRASRLLPWMVRHLELQRPPIVLLRHPLATVSSKEANFAMSTVSATARTESHDRYDELVAAQEDPVLVRIARWCSNTRILLDESRAGQDWLVVHYEHLLLEPEATFGRLLSGIDWTSSGPALVDSVQFRRASRSDFLGNYVDDAREQLGKWRTTVDTGLIEATQELLDDFDISAYRADDVMPTSTGNA